MTDLIFLKLGGSLITDKTKPYVPRLDSLARLAGEIRSALTEAPDVRLLMGHGSGSFGHFAAREYLAADGAGPRPSDYWHGFAEVWYRASQLNRYVVEALHDAGVRTVSLAPCSMIGAEAGKIAHWDLGPVWATLEAGMVPLIYGDIVFDAVKGGVILSTEKLMFHLAHQIGPKRILLAGLEAAVWADFPERQQRVEQITAASYDFLSGRIGGSHGTDVTGGMRSKVEEMLELVRQIPSLTVQIFSGEEVGNLERVIRGDTVGTLISHD